MHSHGSRTGKRPPAAELADNELVYVCIRANLHGMEGGREGGVRWSMEMGPLPPSSLHCTLLPLFSHGTLSSSNRVIDSPLTHWIRARTSRAFSDMQASCFLPQIQGTCPVSQIICHSMANQGNLVRHLHTLYTGSLNALQAEAALTVQRKIP